MEKFYLQARFKNPIFWVNTLLSIIMPVIAYYGMQASDFTTWTSVFIVIKNAISNPYVLGLIAVSLWNNFINPITKGITD